MSARTLLACALLALVLLYVAWFVRADPVAALVFAGPPLALALLLGSAPRIVAFLSGVLALAWFSHGVMVAWSRPPERMPALAEVALALAVIGAGNYEAMRHRFGRRKAP